MTRKTERRAVQPHRPATATPDLLHLLAERLTCAGNYLAALGRQAKDRSTSQDQKLLDNALSQVDQAADLLHQLRRATIGKPNLVPAETVRPPSPNFAAAAPRARTGVQPPPPRSACWRVCFFNHLARGNKIFHPCQRAIVVEGIGSRSEAIEVAKRRFAELEGVPRWELRASTIEPSRIGGDEPY